MTPEQAIAIPGSLSPHLLEREFTDSAHREYLREQAATWASSSMLRENGRRFAQTVYEPVRAIIGPCRVSSGYRCPGLNRAVGGVPSSRHMVALAADLIPLEVSLVTGMRLLRQAMATGGVLPSLDELIFERGAWLHVQAALSGEARGLALMTFDPGSYLPWDEDDLRVARLA